ncbi:ScbR family autoregulator-binding transcription factor [Streptomyces drozdowiczii]|uniref:TetR/AcrR family transcriptional regulator n=1 Tax=Streptomyces drozdowiczii TaxID=202862 RepID=A0ABY6Q171_9ACTN|nr:ScbR family autoregulator-binding transcription factor [Streptomyces drozdowiczii]MCX0241583.1 TetR/AcrR family transcriptional regulator [Streptomyces drozdowiczii]UZK58188.1 TetR/AcrR family transcriptional regulator [Streptomyces drozdowiczii]
MVKQARAAVTRQALISAAAEVFGADGYAMATLPVISGRAGVSSGALHFHFPNKDALAAAVEDAAAESALALTEESALTAEGGRLPGLVAAVGRLMDAVTDDPVVRAGFRLGGDPSRKSEAKLHDWWYEWVRDALVQARADGELAEDVSAEDAAVVIVAATLGLETLGAVDRYWRSAERLVQLWSFALPRLSPAE